MKRLLLIGIAALLTPQVVFGATLYSQGTNFTETISYPYPAGMHAPQGSGVNYGADEADTWYTSVASTSITLRIKPVDTATCATIAARPLYLFSNLKFFTSTTSTIVGDYCDFPLGDIEVGEELKRFDLTWYPTAGALYGDTIGATWNITGTLYSTSTFGFWLFDSGGITPPSDGIVTTVEPTNNSVYLTNPIPFNGTYNNGQSNLYNLVQVRATTTAMTDPVVFQYFLSTSTPPTGTGLTYSINRNLPVVGMYGYEIRLMDTVGEQYQTPWVYGGEFGLATTTTATSDIFVTPVETSCDTFDFFCYMKKAFTWLLYPSDGLVNSYTSLLETLQSKPPIGYFTILKNNITGLTATSSAAVAVVIPDQIKEVIFEPIDTALSGVLWAAFGFIFYRRLKHITI